MWQRLNNCVSGLTTYGVLRPDLVMRWRVRQRLWERSPLTQDEWLEQFGNREGISSDIIAFAYQHIPVYSGLSMARLQPSDDLEADLSWTQICWFDWELDLYDDFLDDFGVDISMTFDISQLPTIADLMRGLGHYRTVPT